MTALLAGGREVEAHEDGTVALLTYGLPGFAVDPEGGLNLSLMRSCTGWPSGVWIDPPRRTTPDGSAFQLQHWTHEFQYALVSDDGDWRDAYLPARGQAFTTPLLAVPADGGAGDLPATQRCSTVEPARDVLVQTVKAAGNPVASGGHDRADPRHSVTIRLVEATGTPAGQRHPAADARPVGRAGRPARGTATSRSRSPTECSSVDLDGQQIETVVATAAASGEPSTAVLGPDQEEAQPVFSRYWLHNRGPAPMGFLPVSVAITPTVARCAAGGRFEVSWVVANQYASSPVAVASRLDLPDGWTATLPEAPAVSGAERVRAVPVLGRGAGGRRAPASTRSPLRSRRMTLRWPGSGAVERRRGRRDRVRRRLRALWTRRWGSVCRQHGRPRPERAAGRRRPTMRPADRARGRRSTRPRSSSSPGRFDHGDAEPAEHHPVGGPRRDPGRLAVGDVGVGRAIRRGGSRCPPARRRRCRSRSRHRPTRRPVTRG